MSKLLTRIDPLVSALSLMLAAYAAIIGAGIVATQAPLTYYADDWIWFSFNMVERIGSICRLSGHPTVTTNLLLAANYAWLDGSAQARGIMAGAGNALAMLLVGGLVVSRCTLAAHARAAILMVFTAIGLSGVLSIKLFWGFGLTDALVLVGGCLAGFGLVQVKEGLWPWLLICGGTLLGLFSFGSGLVLPAAVIYALLAFRVRLGLVVLYGLFSAAMIALVLVVLPACEFPVGSAGAIILAPWPVLKTTANVLGFFPAYVMAQHTVWGTGAFELYWTALGLAMMAAVLVYGGVLLVRRDSDPYVVVLVALALNCIGAALLIGLIRAVLYGTEVGFQGRYAPITVAFWMLCLAIILRLAIRARWGRLRAALVAAMALMVAMVSSIHLPHYLAFHQYLAVSATSVLFAAKDGQPNENLKRYIGWTQWVMKALPMLTSERKDLFAQPVGARFMAGGPPPAADMPACRGSAFRMPRYDEPGLFGFAGRNTSPTGAPLDYVLFYGRGGVVGVGLPTWVDVGSASAQEATLLSGARQAVFQYAHPVAAAYGIGAAWVGLSRSDDAGQLIVGWHADGPCRIPMD